MESKREKSKGYSRRYYGNLADVQRKTKARKSNASRAARRARETSATRTVRLAHQASQTSARRANMSQAQRDALNARRRAKRAAKRAIKPELHRAKRTFVRQTLLLEVLRARTRIARLSMQSTAHSCYHCCRGNDNNSNNNRQQQTTDRKRLRHVVVRERDIHNALAQAATAAIVEHRR